MKLKAGLKGKLAQAYKDNIGANERIDVRLQPSSGEAIVVTDKRVVIIKAGMVAGAGMFGAKAKSFYYNQITSVDLRLGPLGGHIQLTAPGSTEVKDGKVLSMVEAENAVTFTVDYKEHMKAVAEMIRSRLGTQETPAVPANKDDLAEQLKKLADLKEQGALSSEEFEAAKKKLLGI